MAYQYLGSDLAQIQTDAMDAQRRQERAQQLMQAGLNPVQGGNNILALLASTLSTVRGSNMQKEADAKISDVIRRQFEAQSQADQAKAEAEQRKRDEDWQRKLAEIDYTNRSAAQYRAPANIDPNSPEGIAARLQFEKAKAGMQPKAAPAVPAFQQQIDALRGMGINLSPDDLKQVVAGIKPQTEPSAKLLGAEANNKLALINNAIANAKKYQSRTVNGTDFGDIAANTGDTPQLMKSAIQDMLYAKSGASAPVEEVNKAEAMFSPSVFERDATAAAKVQNLITDLERMREQISGQAPTGKPSQAAPQGVPAIGSIVTINGKQYRATGDPADPDMVPL